jgi:hypothetical protein
MLSVTYAEFIYNHFMRVFKLSAIYNTIMLSVIMLYVVMLSVAMLSVVMRCVVMLSVVAPKGERDI